MINVKFLSDVVKTFDAAALRSSPSMRALCMCALTMLVILLDNITGPYFPFTIFYLLILHFSLRYSTVRISYFIAVLAAAGRTVAATGAFPLEIFALASAWQFATSASVYILFCYLLNVHISQAAQHKADLHDLIARQGRSSAPQAQPPQPPQSHRPSTTPLIVFTLLILGAACSQKIYSMTPEMFRLNTVTGLVAHSPWNNHAASLDGVSKGKIAVLTFDDGPADKATDTKILEILSKHRAKSMWFVNCRHLDPALHPDSQANRETLGQAIREGHLIGNHTYNHQNLFGLDILEPRHAELEVTSCSTMLRELTGRQPTFFRAPWGALSERMGIFVSGIGMTSMNWTAYSGDTAFAKQPEALAKHLFDDPSVGFAASIKDGDVILFHNLSSTAAVLDRFLTGLERRGFRFVLPTETRPMQAKDQGTTKDLRTASR